MSTLNQKIIPEKYAIALSESSLEKLSINYCDIDFSLLNSLFKYMGNITELSFCGNNIKLFSNTQNDWNYLKNLKTLSLDNNLIDDWNEVFFHNLFVTLFRFGN